MVYKSNFIRSHSIHQGFVSKDWHIFHSQLKCDLVTLDNGLENEYAFHLLSGKSLPISYDTHVTQYQTVASADFAVNMARAFTRLKSVFITFYSLGEGVNVSPDANAVGSEMRRPFFTFLPPPRAQLFS